MNLLVTISPDYKLEVSSKLKEVPSPFSFNQFAGKLISLPMENQYFPDLENLKWHREKVFLK